MSRIPFTFVALLCTNSNVSEATKPNSAIRAGTKTPMATGVALAELSHRSCQRLSPSWGSYGMHAASS